MSTFKFVPWMCLSTTFYTDIVYCIALHQLYAITYTVSFFLLSADYV